MTEQEPSPRLRGLVDHLSRSLATAFGPVLREAPRGERFRREVASFLASGGEPHVAQLVFDGVELPTAVRAFSRWCNLVDGRADEAGVVAEFRGSHPECDHEVRPVFHPIEVGPGERERCVVDGVVFLEVDTHRAVVVVKLDRSRMEPELKLDFHLPRGDRVDSAVLKSFHAARLRYDVARGRHLAFDARALGFLAPLGVTWDDVFLPPGLVEEFRRNTSLFLAARSKGATGSLPPSRSVLLYGPPGTGKTLLGKALTSDLAGTTFLWVTPGGFDYSHDPGFFFRWARERTPAVLFFEDLDLVAGVRGHGDDAGSLGEILAQMDGFTSNAGLVVVATTNDARAIDEALRRPGRFDRQIHVDLPGPEERRQMLDRFLRDMPVDDREHLLAEVARATRGFSGAHLREVVDTVLLRRATEGSAVGAVTEADLRQALASLRRTRADLGFAAAQGREVA